MAKLTRRKLLCATAPLAVAAPLGAKLTLGGEAAAVERVAVAPCPAWSWPAASASRPKANVTPSGAAASGAVAHSNRRRVSLGTPKLYL